MEAPALAQWILCQGKETGKIKPKFLPDLFKDELIYMIHFHEIVIIKNEVLQKDNPLEICFEKLEKMKQKEEELISDETGFKRPNSTMIDNIFNIKDGVDQIQDEVTHATDKMKKYVKVLNSSKLQSYLEEMKDVTQLSFTNITMDNKPHIQALFVSFYMSLEARILGLLETLSVYIKLTDEKQWILLYNFNSTEKKLIDEHWPDIVTRTETELKTFDFIELGELDEYANLKGIGEGILVPLEQLYQDESCRSCEELKQPRKLFDIQTVNFQKYSKCTGEVYDCSSNKTGAKIYDVCFKVKVISTTFGATATCRFCKCKCFDSQDPALVNKFTLSPVLSNYSENKIVVGISLKVKDGIVRLVIEQASISSYGRIIKTKKGGDYIPNEISTEISDEIIALNATHHEIALTDVKAPPNHVITGVRFGSYPIKLEIRVHEYDFFTGKLNQTSNGSWISEPDPVDKLTLADLIPPNDESKDDEHEIEENKIVAFQPTSWEKDVASHIIPYLSTEFQAHTESPLVGVGIIYQKNSKHQNKAGFISTRTHKYNYLNLWTRKKIELDNIKADDIHSARMDLAMIVGCSISGIIVIAFLLFQVVLNMRKRNTVKSTELQNQSADTIFLPMSGKKLSSDDSSENEKGSSEDSDDSSDDESDSSVDEKTKKIMK
uniref:CSON008078 protein n=1 Tax=Culicoides sonorensis TaxID=179676 RepID=A0A336MAG0_CULSO